MPHDLTHASFFSGAGGLDIGLERAGWTTVSFSEIDPYASAVLEQRWPGVPNLGSITDIASGRAGVGSGEQLRQHADDLRPDGGQSRTGGSLDGSVATAEDQERGGDRMGSSGAATATLWTGGFPCQDLSVAGKRRGMGAGTRSGLAYAFLDLVEQHRPPAVLLENVPGLLSSHAGRDFGALLAALGQLGYGWAYRILDARYFGVPQRRRRVFILGLHARVDPSGQGAAEVLSVGTRCSRHPATGHQAGEGTSGVLADGATSTRTVQAAFGHHGYTLGAQDADGGYLQIAPALTARQDVVSPSPDPHRDGAPDGLAGRPHDRDGVAATLNSGGNNGGFRNPAESGDDVMLPLGLDSHRFRCCGNGVVSGVSEWIGERLAGYLAAMERAA